MKRWLPLTILGLVSYLLALVLTVPAPHAYQLVSGQLPLEFWGLSGNLWHGQAATVTVRDQRIQDLRWRFDPTGLVTARVAYHINAAPADGDISARVATRTGSSVMLRDVDADVGADELVRLISRTRYPATLGGRLRADIPEAGLADGRPGPLNGTVTWDDASVSGFGETVTLGGFRLELETPSPGSVRGTFSDNGNGPLQVQGELALDPDGEVTGTADVATTADAGEPLLQGMRALGIPEPEDDLRLEFSGNVNNPAGFTARLQ